LRRSGSAPLRPSGVARFGPAPFGPAPFGPAPFGVCAVQACAVRVLRRSRARRLILP